MRKDYRFYATALIGGMLSTSCQAPYEKPQTPAVINSPAATSSADIVLGEPMVGAQAALTISASDDYALSPAAPLKPDLWREMRNQMRLDLHLDQTRVQQEIRWLQKHPSYFKRLAPRLQTYLPYIYTQTQVKGMPAELALLPIVESALDTFAFSHGGAAGPWQFVSGTARHYGLEINDWYDGRRDIVASTDAALKYLSDLNNRFDDWYLALAGYNAGQGNVSKALRKNPGAGFFDLRLPKETQAYVPRLLALSAVVSDPQKYGITLPEIVPKRTFNTLETHSQFQLTKLATVLELDMKELYQWNPSINQWATPPKGPHRIIVPARLDVRQAQAAVDAVDPGARVDWKEIKVANGDTLSQIARRHGTDVTSLRMANNLVGSRIRAGSKLLIPKSAEALKSSPRSAQGDTTYVVAAGDSLWTIARAHKVSLNKLMRNNHLGPKDTLSVGRELKIPGTQSATRKVTRKVRYKVRKGDSLSRIANKFNVSTSQIAKWNKIDAKRYLQPGQGLLLYVNVTGG